MFVSERTMASAWLTSTAAVRQPDENHTMLDAFQKPNSHRQTTRAQTKKQTCISGAQNFGKFCRANTSTLHCCNALTARLHIHVSTHTPQDIHTENYATP